MKSTPYHEQELNDSSPKRDKEFSDCIEFKNRGLYDDEDDHDLISFIEVRRVDKDISASA